MFKVVDFICIQSKFQYCNNPRVGIAVSGCTGDAAARADFKTITIMCYKGINECLQTSSLQRNAGLLIV